MQAVPERENARTERKESIHIAMTYRIEKTNKTYLLPRITQLHHIVKVSSLMFLKEKKNDWHISFT